MDRQTRGGAPPPIEWVSAKAFDVTDTNVAKYINSLCFSGNYNKAQNLWEIRAKGRSSWSSSAGNEKQRHSPLLLVSQFSEQA